VIFVKLVSAYLWANKSGGFWAESPFSTAEDGHVEYFEDDIEKCEHFSYTEFPNLLDVFLFVTQRWMSLSSSEALLREPRAPTVQFICV